MENKYKNLLIVFLNILKVIFGWISLILLFCILLFGGIMSLFDEKQLSEGMMDFFGLEKSSLLWFLPLLLLLFAGYMSDFFGLSVWTLKTKNKKSGKKRAKWRKLPKINFK